MANPPVDAVLVVAFGGPEGPGDVLPFLRNVTRGRDVPDSRLRVVAGHYLEAFGGVSPINAQVAALGKALEADLADLGHPLPVYWGNRNWHPFLAESISRMAADGRRHALSLTTSPYPSYSSCRQYREDVEEAAAMVEGAPRITRLRHFFTDDGFLTAQAAAAAVQLEGLSDTARLVFTAHSLPMAMAETSGPTGDGYVSALRLAAAGVVERLGGARPWDLVFQSRSGAPGVPWLEPDVGDHLTSLYGAGVRDVVLVPIGFLSDHVEVLYDLDIEAADRAAGLVGLTVRRASTVGTDPAFVRTLSTLVRERLPYASGPEVCTAACCPRLTPRPPPRPLPG